jgi:S1-C subfamily serine protease
MAVSEPNNLLAFSDLTTTLVERAASSIVTVHGGRRWGSSGIHWRPGVIVTAEEALEHDENINLTLPGGRQVEALLAGRDPTTDVAVLRFQPDGLPAVTTVDTQPRAGQVVLAVGSHEGGPLAAFGIVAFSGGAWRSVRGGTIDSLIRLDLALSLAAEGGALVDVHGQLFGMTVLGPRRRALAIPSTTIDRCVDQLLARGHVYRGYLGASLRPVKHRHEPNGSQSTDAGRGVLVVSLDPKGPSARAGVLVGDIVTAWSGKPINRVREVLQLLGVESVESIVELVLIIVHGLKQHYKPQRHMPHELFVLLMQMNDRASAVKRARRSRPTSRRTQPPLAEQQLALADTTFVPRDPTTRVRFVG